MKTHFQHQIECDEIAHITTMVYNAFLHSAGEAPFYLLFWTWPLYASSM